MRRPAPALVRGVILIAVLLPAATLSPGEPAYATSHATRTRAATGADEGAEHPRWRWPVDGVRHVSAPFRAPAHRYGAGHRGLDLSASIGAEVRSPADGVVAFVGTVVDRQLLTIAHDDGYVSTLEPVVSTLAPGAVVHEGDVVGRTDVGGHTAAGDVHLGVRLDGDYINPLLLLGEVPRAVLLPCCARP